MEPGAFVPILMFALQFGEEKQIEAQRFREVEPCSVTNLQ
jgi:hypothetical protein